MRQRLRSARSRTMARRPEDGRYTLSPRGRLIAGWLAAIVLLVGIAAVVRVLGLNSDGAPIGAAGSGSPAAASLAEITFGTGIDPATGQVVAESEVDRFVAGDTFAYSAVPPGSIPPEVYVEVVAAASGQVVQPPVDAQAVTDARAVAFAVGADLLLDAFGAGEFQMRIYPDPDGDPLAEGTFELVASATPSPSP